MWLRWSALAATASSAAARHRALEGGYPVGWSLMSKKTKRKKARMRRSKANHGKRPNMGR